MNKSDKTRQQLLDEVKDLKSRSMEAEETLRAILNGEVDGLVIKTVKGDRVFTLSGADHPYRIMVETMNEGAVTLAADGTILYCNQRFADIVKEPLEKVMGSSIYQYISSKDLQLFKMLLKEGLKGNSKVELALQTGDENSVPVLLSISTLQQTDIPGAMCMVVTDLTEQKRDEDILAEGKLTSQILNQAAEIFVLCDHQGRIIRASQSTNTLFDGSPIFQTFDEAFHLINSDGTPFALLSAMSNSSIHAVEATFKKGENDVFSFLLSANALMIDKKLIGIVVVMVDVTSRRQVAEKLRESEEYFKEITENSSDVIIITDKNGDIKYCSRSIERYSGYKPEELIGRSAFTFIHPDDLERARDDYGKAILTRDSAIPNEFRLVRKDGSIRYFSGLGKNLLDNPAVAGFVMNIRDITERKQAEELLKKAHDELELKVKDRTKELAGANLQLTEEIKERKDAEQLLQTALSEIKILKDQLEAENIYFRQEHKMKHRFDHIIGQSDGLKYVLYRAEQVAPSNTTVLILGETGTGKELIASAIHDMSPRKERPLITVNCAALPGNLIESELFGREKGAFTGADVRRMGRFEIANGSTLCLDEIGELPLELQGKLLRVIQHNEFERLGSSHTIKVDVRIIATTNRNLEEEVRKGRFRQDLYYRLNVFPITVPPLRQRKDDIPLMVQAFVERYSRKLGKQITSIPKETMKALQDYPWPGNVRELESIIERAVILCPGPVLQLADKLEISSPPLSSAMRTLEETERNQILKILSETRWRIEGKDGAAAILGIHPSTLRARMHKLGIVRPETKEPA